jgi:hypothetical protein
MGTDEYTRVGTPEEVSILEGDNRGYDHGIGSEDERKGG